jgi:predicted nucleotidyltransferase
MRSNAAEKPIAIPGYRYHSPDIPLSAIRRFARQLGERFHPDQIILFGSYANGQPHAASDVDLLVVMPAANEVNQSIRMTLAFEPPFPLDLIVRTPTKLRRRLAEGDSFLEEIVTRGIVLYEKRNGPLDTQGRGRSRRRNRTHPKGPTAQ